MPEIGATLREARMRARIDVSEIEAQTKIRARYLRAIENEEWDLLPGPTFIKSFLRTYATALGLDGKTLVDEYRLHYEHPGEPELQPLASPAPRRRARPAAADVRSAGGGRGTSRGYAITVSLIGIVIVFLVIGLLTRGSSPRKGGDRGTHRTASARGHHHRGTHHRGEGPVHHGVLGATGSVALSLRATSTVWVCLLGDAKRKLIPGVDLRAGERSGPFHARRYQVTLGNAHVSLTVNGRPMSVPESTHAIGYEITAAGSRPLAATSQPTCA